MNGWRTWSGDFVLFVVVVTVSRVSFSVPSSDTNTNKAITSNKQTTSETKPFSVFPLIPLAIDSPTQHFCRHCCQPSDDVVLADESV